MSINIETVVRAKRLFCTTGATEREIGLVCGISQSVAHLIKWGMIHSQVEPKTKWQQKVERKQKKWGTLHSAKVRKWRSKNRWSEKIIPALSIKKEENKKQEPHLYQQDKTPLSVIGRYEIPSQAFYDNCRD